MPGVQTRRERTDAVVIGSNQAGVQLAVEFARAGFRTVLIDCFAQPGACLGEAPSMPLVVSANMARLARSAGDFGVQTGEIGIDLAKVQLRRRAVLNGLRVEALRALQDMPHLRVFAGEPRFEGPGLLRVGEPPNAGRSSKGKTSNERALEMEAPRFFINTGARPVLPALPGLDCARYLTSSSAMEVEELPRHLLVLGGSYRGVELAQMFRRFGSRVCIVERQDHLLAQEDRDIAAAVAETLREDGVEVFLHTEAMGVLNDAAGGVQLTVRTPSGMHTLTGSQLLVVEGCEPNTQSLNLGAAGVAVDSRGYIRVNEQLETSAPGVYGLGVVNGGVPFAQVAYDDFRVIRTNVLESRHDKKAKRTSPYTAFTNPPLGRIGLTHAQARAQDRKVRVAKLPMSKVERAATLAESRGLIKVLIDPDTKRILGAAVLGVHAAEIIGMLQIAMMADMPYTALRDGMSAHPTLAGAINNLFVALETSKPFKKENVNEQAPTFSDRHQGAA